MPRGTSAGLPADLAGPVSVALAKVEQLPGADALPGGCVFEPKWDGDRAVIVRNADGARAWSRQGNDLTDRFPEIAAAVKRMLHAGCVVDGELVALDSTGRLSFDRLQRRLVTTRANARRLLSEAPASYMAFDLLAVSAVDIRTSALDHPPWPPRDVGGVGAAAAAHPNHPRSRRRAGVDGGAARGAGCRRRGGQGARRAGMRRGGGSG